MNRRELLGTVTVAAAGAISCAPATASNVAAPPRETAKLGGRKLGNTGASVEIVSLGGEGSLRTTGRAKDAVPVILEALRLGVRYCDTAPAYQQSQDYYGMAFKEAGDAARKGVFLASKTHARDRDGALYLLDDSLRRLNTTWLDLWQLHDLRTIEDLDDIFAKGGAIEAVEKAKSEGRVRHVGITGHHDPAILVEAMRRYPVDTVLCAINPADPDRMPFITTVVAEARKRNVAVIAMKVMAAGQLLADAAATPQELIEYAASFADTCIIGCKTPGEVQQNLAIGRAIKAEMSVEKRAALEARIAPRAERYASFKA